MEIFASCSSSTYCLIQLYFCWEHCKHNIFHSTPLIPSSAIKRNFKWIIGLFWYYENKAGEDERLLPFKSWNGLDFQSIKDSFLSKSEIAIQSIKNSFRSKNLQSTLKSLDGFCGVNPHMANNDNFNKFIILGLPIRFLYCNIYSFSQLQFGRKKY